MKEFNENEIEYSSQKKSWQASDYLIGLGKTKSHPIILIDLTKALSTESFEKIIKNGKINSDYSESAA